jgi:glycosyltransferase involved in cell wall biosynthesis
VEERQFPYEWLSDPSGADAARFLDQLDIFHLHWPEWVSHSVEAHRTLIARLQSAAVRILWTQHNLVPHSRDEALIELYRLWAAAADGVVHHSASGQTRVRDRYPFRRDAIHRVIPHPHFGHLHSAVAPPVRDEVERELGLRPCAIRLGIIGAPRPEKNVQLVLDAFAACRRADLGLLVLSCAGERVPDDPRISAYQYEMVDRVTYDRRLAALDVLVFPIEPGELLTSGVVGDAVAAGLPSLISDWDFLSETLGNAAIPYGRTREDLTACLDRLDANALTHSAAAARALQPLYARERVAEQLLDLLTEVGSAKL